MKMKYLWIPAAVFLCLTVPFRIYQTLFLIDPETNFYEKGTEFTLSLLLSMLALFVIILMVMSLLNKQKLREHQVQKNYFAGAFALIAGGLLITESAVQIVQFTKQSKPEQMVLCVASALAAVAFFVMAVSSFFGKNIFQRLPLLALLTSLWGCARLIITFLSYTNIASDSSSMFDMIGIMFALMFLFTQAKLFAKVATANTTKRLFVLGLLAIVFICVFNIPELVQHFAGIRTLQIANLLPKLIDLSLAAYIFSICLEMTHEFSQPIVEEKNTDQEPAKGEIQ